MNETLINKFVRLRTRFYLNEYLPPSLSWFILFDQTGTENKRYKNTNFFQTSGNIILVSSQR